MSLVALGLGYCAKHFIHTRALKRAAWGSARANDDVAALRAQGFQVARWDGDHVDSGLRQRLFSCEALIVSAAPAEEGDPVLRAFRSEIRSARALKTIVYLSSIGVYGGHDGAWIDEDAPLRPANERSRARLRAERAWAEAAAGRGSSLHILRLAGIYGPARNALRAVAAGTARRIVKEGQAFNRIHVEDVARAIERALVAPASGVWNVADDEPSEQGDPLDFAADLLGSTRPPSVRLEDAALGAMAESFWGESKRVRNTRLKAQLGVSLAYPTYREGLTALHAEGEGRSSEIEGSG